jgi:hypothetical protein
MASEDQYAIKIGKFPSLCVCVCVCARCASLSFAVKIEPLNRNYPRTGISLNTSRIPSKSIVIQIYIWMYTKTNHP